MSKKEDWEPRDEFLEDDGRAGKAEIDRILVERGLSLKKTITSRDVGVDMARYDLRREMPEGWYGWQLPIYLLERPVSFFFIQVALPGTILPSHEHEVAQFRIVLSGGLIYTAQPTDEELKKEDYKPEKGIELKSGDWIYTPPKAKYTLSVATNPGHICTVHYCY